jgi:predicted transcriptional regulator of viral defense system
MVGAAARRTVTTLGFYRKLAGQKRVTTRMAAQLAGVSIPAASMALRRLAAEGLSLPLKKGSWIIGAAASKPGALVTAAADPYLAYLSGWSALRLHERIQQLPQTQFAVTLGRPGEVEAGGSRIALHRIKPELFGGYAFDARVDGFVASPEKALFDLAYLTAMNRSRVSGSLPEANLQGLRWKDVQTWLRRIPTPRVRAAVERVLRSIREQHAAVKD